MRKEKGSVSELMATGICILAMTIVVISYMSSVELIAQKTAVDQLARKYILRMETVGYLTEADKGILQQELQQMGVTELNLDGTTLMPAAYGDPITLHMKGRLKKQYEFEETRVSTAKN